MPHGEAKTFSIPDVEILRVGVWNGREYTAADLDAIANAHLALKESGFMVPRVTIDHDETSTRAQGDGGPALGFVDSVHRVKDRLFANLIKVPAMLAEAIGRDNFPGRSIEVWWDVELGGVQFPAVLSALTFLGADLPAVDGLADIEKLYEETAVLSADKFVMSDKTVACLSAQPDTLPMESTDVELTAIAAALGLPEDATEAIVLERITTLSALEQESSEGEDTEPGPAAEEGSDPEPAVEAEAEPAAELSLKLNNSKLVARVTKLEKELAKRDAENSVDLLVRSGKLLPKQRGQWVALNLQNPDLFTSMSKDLEAQVDLGELGTSEGDESDEFAPTKDELAAAHKVDPTLTADDIRATKLRAAGRPVPVASES